MFSHLGPPIQIEIVDVLQQATTAAVFSRRRRRDPSDKTSANWRWHRRFDRLGRHIAKEDRRGTPVWLLGDFIDIFLALLKDLFDFLAIIFYFLEFSSKSKYFSFMKPRTKQGEAVEQIADRYRPDLSLLIVGAGVEWTVTLKIHENPKKPLTCSWYRLKVFNVSPLKKQRGSTKGPENG